MKIQIILSLFNGANVIELQLRSWLLVFPGASFVIVDDASTDGGCLIVAEVNEQTNTEMTLVCPVNRRVGCYAAFYVGMAISDKSMDLVCLSDQDDIEYPMKAELSGHFSDPRIHAISHGYEVFFAENVERNYLVTGGVCHELLGTPSIGCSYLLKPDVIAATLEILENFKDRVIPPHDWLVYFACRLRYGRGSWKHSSSIAKAYRQHTCNLSGAKQLRLNKLSRVPYICQVAVEFARYACSIDKKLGLFDLDKPTAYRYFTDTRFLIVTGVLLIWALCSKNLKNVLAAEEAK